MRRLSICVLLASGCLQLDLADGVLLCSTSGNRCPSGYQCAGDDFCYRNGHLPDLSGEVGDLAGGGDQAATDALPPEDLSPPSDLTPLEHQGDPCTAGVDVCDTGHCIDGYCCDSDCTGACEACDVSASPGMCMPVSGPSHGSRSCNGSGTCGGQCNGASSSCTYPPVTVICGAACDGHCDAAGGCSAGTGGSCPNGFACGSNACLTSCSQPADCQTNFTCTAPNCVRVAESDCLDGLDNNGDGLIDCDDPTCTTVMCVPAPGNGDELGFLTAASCPATGYTITEPQYQGLNMPTCGGCSCSSSFTCTLKGNMYYASSGMCSGNNISLSAASSGVCVQTTTRTYDAYAMSAPSQSGSCSPTGSATLPNPSFDGSKTRNFCGASRSSANNCNHDSSKICVPKPPVSTKLCARVPGSGSCPAGYTGGTSDTYYTGYSKGSCGSCGGCSLNSVNCPLDNLYLYSDTNCQTYIGVTVASSTSCYAAIINSGGGQSTTYSVGSYNYISGNGTVSCNSPTVSTNYSTPSGASVICCQP